MHYGRLTIVAALAVMTTGLLQATDFTWDNPAGGAFLDSVNWTPVGGPPGTNDIAILAEDAAAPIVLDDDTSLLALKTAAGSGAHTLDLAGRSLELLRYKYTTPYADWALAVGAESSLVITSSVSGGKIPGLDKRVDDIAKANSISYYIDAGGMLNLSGPNTVVEGLNVRTEIGGKLHILHGAKMTLGQDKARETSIYQGSSSDDVVLLVDGAGSYYYDTFRNLQNATMVITNGAKVENFRESYIGTSGTSGKLVIAGKNTKTEHYSIVVGGANATGYMTVQDGATATDNVGIANANNAFGQLLVTGAGSTLRAKNVSICNGSYNNATGILWVADSAIATVRYFEMRAGGVIRVENATLRADWASGSTPCRNRGGRIEGVGTVASTYIKADQYDILLNDAGGVVAPGLPVGKLTLQGWGKSTKTAGAFTNSPTGVVEIELASASEYDVLAFVNSRVHLGGTLEVKLRDGFEPELGDSFQIFEFNTSPVVGSFDLVLLPELNEGLMWSAAALYSDGTLEVVEYEERDEELFTWSYHNGGLFNVAPFWVPEGGPPTDDDAAILSGTLADPIELQDNTGVDTLAVSNGVVTLELAGFDLAVYGRAGAWPGGWQGLELGPASSLTLRNSGEAGGVVGGDGSADAATPRLRLAPTAQLTLTEGVAVTAAAITLSTNSVVALQEGHLTTTTGSLLLEEDGVISGTGELVSLSTTPGLLLSEGGNLSVALRDSHALQVSGFGIVSNTADSRITLALESTLGSFTNSSLRAPAAHLHLAGRLELAYDAFGCELPTNGATLKLFDWATHSGAFDVIELPEVGVWSLDNLYLDGTISVAPYVKPPDLALDHVWTNAAGGDFMVKDNWDQLDVPGTNDTAVLAAVPASIYLSEPRLTINSLRFAGGPVELDLNGCPLPFLNYTAGTSYDNWALVAESNAVAVVTNSGATVATMGVLSEATATSSSTYVKSNALLHVTGARTRLDGSHLRVRSGGLKITAGAKANFGSDPVRSTVNLIGHDAAGEFPLADVSGSGSLFYGVTVNLYGGSMRAAAGGKLHVFRTLTMGRAGQERGNIYLDGSGTTTDFYKLALVHGSMLISTGAVYGMTGASTEVGVASGADATVEVVGSGASFDCKNVTIGGTSSRGRVVARDGGAIVVRTITMSGDSMITLADGKLDFSTAYKGFGNSTTLNAGVIAGVGRFYVGTTGGELWIQNNGATIAPGAPGGVLSFVNCDHIINGPASSLAFKLGGDTTAEHGQLLLNNSGLELEGGTLKVEWVEGYRPVRKTTYQLIAWSNGGSISGTFDELELPAGGKWLTDELYTAGTLTIAPETGTVLIVR